MSFSSQKKTLVCVTGPIAAGVTTLSQELSKLLQLKKVFEPRIEKFDPFFSSFNTNPKKFAFRHEIAFLTQTAYLQDIIRQDPYRHSYIQDFVPFQHVEVYAYVQRKFNYITAEEYNILNRLSHLLEPNYIIPSVLIYRPANWSVMRDRIKKRGRKSEILLKPRYLKALSERFEKWIVGWKRSPVIRLSYDFEFKNKQDLLMISELVKKYIDRKENRE